jgi:hypothetical protein
MPFIVVMASMKKMASMVADSPPVDFAARRR